MDDVAQKVIEIVAEVFKKNKDELTCETRFVEDLHAKSVQVIEIIALMESEFNIEIPFVEARKNKTLEDVITYIENKLKNQKMV
jgi:acyl carrier protein